MSNTRNLPGRISDKSPKCGGTDNLRTTAIVSVEFLGLTFYRITEDEHNRITEDGDFRID